MFERLTRARAARSVIVAGAKQAHALGDSEARPEHLLLGVLDDAAGIGSRVLRGLGLRLGAVVAEVAPLGNAEAEVLRSVGVDLQAVRVEAEAAFGPGALDGPRRRRQVGPLQSRLLGEHLPFAESTQRALKQGVRQARLLEHHMGPEHILLGLLADGSDPVPRTLRRLGLDPATVRGQLIDELQQAA